MAACACLYVFQVFPHIFICVCVGVCLCGGTCAPVIVYLPCQTACLVWAKGGACLEEEEERKKEGRRKRRRRAHMRECVSACVQGLGFVEGGGKSEKPRLKFDMFVLSPLVPHTCPHGSQRRKAG